MCCQNKRHAPDKKLQRAPLVIDTSAFSTQTMGKGPICHSPKKSQEGLGCSNLFATDSNLQQPEQRQEVPRGLMTGLCVTVGHLKESTETENIGRAVHRSACKAQLTQLWMVTHDRCVFGLTKQNKR